MFDTLVSPTIASLMLHNQFNLRSHPHTPGRYPCHVRSPSVSEGISFFVGIWGTLGTLPEYVGTIIDSRFLLFVIPCLVYEPCTCDDSKRSGRIYFSEGVTLHMAGLPGFMVN